MTPPTTDPRLLVHAYVDGELDPAHALEVERMLAADPALAAERERLEALRDAIRAQLPREDAPPQLTRRIEAAVGLRRADARLAPRPSWRALAASVALAAVLASGATWLVRGPAPADTTADMVVASHLRALMAPQPADVASSDRHTVKPWFNGRIPESPRVVDLASEGFPLIGGRIDVIGQTPVPTLVYHYNRHVISLTAIPGGHPLPGGQAQIAGYNIVSWSDGGIAYWAVSDVAASDLETFAKDFRAANP
ncbi:MAG TPA: anti-sigma factor [Xanthobacteraceae bacterium]|jgi:anti-sigma factor RsiW